MAAYSIRPWSGVVTDSASGQVFIEGETVEQLFGAEIEAALRDSFTDGARGNRLLWPCAGEHFRDSRGREVAEFQSAYALVCDGEVIGVAASREEVEAEIAERLAEEREEA